MSCTPSSVLIISTFITSRMTYYSSTIPLLPKPKPIIPSQIFFQGTNVTSFDTTTMLYMRSHGIFPHLVYFRILKKENWMSVPLKYRNLYVPIKYFLTSYRALSDGRRGIRHLDDYLNSPKITISDWKVIWIGACTLLRCSVELFQVDAKSCVDEKLKNAIRDEWTFIRSEKGKHKIFWEFLRKERNNILHEYQWAAYEAWMNDEGKARPASLSLLDIKPEDMKNVLIMRSGEYKDHNSLDLLKESANWAEARIFGAIHRAGYDPEENRNLQNFQKQPPAQGSLLTDVT